MKSKEFAWEKRGTKVRVENLKARLGIVRICEISKMEIAL